MDFWMGTEKLGNENFQGKIFKKSRFPWKMFQKIFKNDRFTIAFPHEHIFKNIRDKKSKKNQKKSKFFK